MYNEIENEQDYLDAYEDYMVQKMIDEKAEKHEEEIDALEYQSKMAEQMIDSIYENN